VPVRGDETRPGTAPLQHRVGRLGGPVDEHRRALQQLAGGDPQRCGIDPDGVEHAILEGAACRQRLGDAALTAPADHDAVREGAADVDTDPIIHELFPFVDHWQAFVQPPPKA
jgi:hypothetical protein